MVSFYFTLLKVINELDLPMLCCMPVFFFFKIFIDLCMCLPCTWGCGSEQSAGSPGARIIGSCELLDVGVWSSVLCKSSNRS